MAVVTDRATCGRIMQTGEACLMDPDHRGRCSASVFTCEGCGKTRRGSAHSTDVVRLGDGSVDDVFEFCFMCSVVEREEPWY